MTRWLLVAVLVLLAGCTAGTPDPVPSPAAVTTSHPPGGRAKIDGSQPKPLLGTRWVFHHTDSAPAFLRMDGRKVTGSGGCNTFSGDMTVKVNVIKFRNITTTRIPCPPAQSAVLQTMLEVLQADYVTWAWQGPGGYLRLDGGSHTRLILW